MMTTKYNVTFKYIFIIILFLGLLLGLRWFWYTVFATSSPPPIVQGVLDMRGWDFENSNPSLLDGEWEFYPEEFLTKEELFEGGSAKPNYINVPGDWRSAWPEDNGSSFGYGTYRLRILIDQPLDEPYAFWFQRIEASSSVEINGKTDAVIGVPAEHEASYKPRSVSYTASYTAINEQEIELLVRVANFDHPFKGGITHSITFGTQASIDSVRWYSIGFQLVTFTILLLHGFYSLIIYMFSRKDKVFLVFFLLLLTAGITVTSDHDNLLMQWIPLNYTWAAKTRILSYLWVIFFILLMGRSFSGIKTGKRLFYGYLTVLSAYTLFTLASPIRYVYYLTEFRLFAIVYLFPLAWFAYIITRMLIANRNDAVFLLCSATGISSSVIWGIFSNRGDTGNIYYPVDIIAALVGFSAYWFKRYFRNAEENAKLTDQLRELDKQKDEFLANTSHELRTPLHGIMNIAQTVAFKEKHVMDGKSFKDMELLITISRRMSHLLDDLLDVVQLQDKRIVLQKEALRLQSVVSGVVGMLHYMTEDKPVQLKISMEESLPLVLADEKRLVQILFNLVHNALKYTDQGIVTVSAEIKDGQVVVAVSDTGVGMDEETRARVFLPYEQGSHGISDGGGIGLGLSISKQLVELHGSALEVQSEPDKGSSFYFSLPLAASSGSQMTPGSVDREVEYTEPYEDASIKALLPDTSTSVWTALQSAAPFFADVDMNILAVDDDPVNLKVLASILVTERHHIQTATSGREALELLNAKPWDLMIIDVMMPHMSGYDLTRKVRERFSISELPVLLLTARSQPADIYAGFLAGANDYVTKPVDALELKYRVGSLTALKQSVNERLRMEAAYLQAQIHPHFLFNTLNSIMALSEIDTEKMNKLGEAFTSYLRISFDFLNSGERVALTHELNLVRAYLYIEKERFEERLNVQWEVDPDLDLIIPPLTLQPLVENAVRHGVLSQEAGVTIAIRITRRDGAVLFEVRDNGKGMDGEMIRQLLDQARKGKGGIGISNTNRRLTQMYGKGLTIRSKPGEGTNVSFVIPALIK